MDSEILDQLTTLEKNLVSEVTKRYRKKKIDLKINGIGRHSLQCARRWQSARFKYRFRMLSIP